MIYRHEGKFKNGPVHNFLASLRVAPKKEGTAVLSLYFPRSQFFELDAAFNVTVPSFDPCTASLRLIEKRAQDYNVRICINCHKYQISSFKCICSDGLPRILVFGTLDRTKRILPGW